VELQISHSVCAEIPAANNIWEAEGGYRENTARIVPVEGRDNSGGGAVSQSYTYAFGDTAEIQRVGGSGIFEREKQPADTRAAREFAVQVRESELLVPRVLRRHGGEERKTDCGVHPESTERGSSIGPDDNERIRRPVHG